MKERITFVHGIQDAFDPGQWVVTKDSVRISTLAAAREDRLTFSLQQLPQELWLAVRQCQELHVRWASAAAYPSVSPFSSRISPGLHLFYTPRPNRPPDLLCRLLRKAFGQSLKCVSPEETFTSLPILSKRFAPSAAFQYYQLLPSLSEFALYVEQKLCPNLGEPCYHLVSRVKFADSLDLDYDATSQSFIIRLFWRKPGPAGTWTESVFRYGDSTVEVGLLASETPTEPDALSLGGFLTVVGEDEKASPTLFSFPSRHHAIYNPSESTFRTRFVSPTGLHPTLRLEFPSYLSPPDETCALHTYLTLPSALFPDKYQLSEPLFLASKNLRSIKSVSGETDLEAPDWAVGKWGSSMLVELAPPSSSTAAPWHSDIPLHLRYLAPTAGGIAHTDIPWPVVFWACRAKEGSKMETNPFDRVNLGYDGLFGQMTAFYHLEPDGSAVNASRGLVENLAVPVLDQNHTAWLEFVTVVVIIGGFVWVLWRLVQVGLGVGEVVYKDVQGLKKGQ